MRLLLATPLSCAACLLISAGVAFAGQWTCPVGGEVIPYDSRDGAHMQQWKQRHIEAHRQQLGGSSGGASPGMSGMSTGDPAVDMMLPVIEHGSRAIGEGLARALFGDPEAQRRQAELHRLEQERLAELQRQREAELERQRREKHQRLLSDLVFLGGSEDMPLAELMDDDSAPAVDFDGARSTEPLPLLGLDDDPAPAGTSFFGEGGVGSAASDDGGLGLVDLRDLPDYGVAVPDAPAAGARGFGPMTDVPAPYIEGNVGQARNGSAALGRVADLESRLAARQDIDRDAAQARVDALRRKARIIEKYDQLMNAFNGRRVDSMREMAEARAAAIETRKQFVEEALSTLGGAVGDFRKAHEELVRSGVWEQLNEALNLEDDVSSAQGLQRDLAALAAVGRGEETDTATWAKLTERAGELVVKFAEADGALIERYGEKGAKRILGRAAFWVKSGRGLAESTRHSMDLLLLHQETAFLADGVGEAAVQQRQFHERYARKIREFHDGRRELESLLQTPASDPSLARSNATP
jgi:hypothetical protein